jgi:hypothetical protein
VGALTNDRRIILHIGLHKTGTTTIQNVLHANRDFLLRHEGALYPSLAPNLSNALLTIFGDDARKLKAGKMRGFTTEELAARRKKHLNSLMLRSSKAVNKRSSTMPMRSRRTTPNPRFRPKVELFCGDPRSQLDLLCVGEALSGH